MTDGRPPAHPVRDFVTEYLRAVKPRTWVALGLALLVVLVLLVANVVNGGFRPRPTPRPPDAAIPSASDTGSDSVDESPGEQSPTSYPDDAAVLTRATEFTTAWLRRELPADEWLDGLRPHATDGLIERLTGVDPSAVPADAILGTPEIVDRSDVAADVTLPIGSSDALRLGLVRCGATGAARCGADDEGWQVTTLGREAG